MPSYSFPKKRSKLARRLTDYNLRSGCDGLSCDEWREDKKGGKSTRRSSTKHRNPGRDSTRAATEDRGKKEEVDSLQEAQSPLEDSFSGDSTSRSYSSSSSGNSPPEQTPNAMSSSAKKEDTESDSSNRVEEYEDINEEYPNFDDDWHEADSPRGAQADLPKSSPNPLRVSFNESLNRSYEPVQSNPPPSRDQNTPNHQVTKNSSAGLENSFHTVRSSFDSSVDLNRDRQEESPKRAQRPLQITFNEDLNSNYSPIPENNLPPSSDSSSNELMMNSSTKVEDCYPNADLKDKESDEKRGNEKNPTNVNVAIEHFHLEPSTIVEVNTSASISSARQDDRTATSEKEELLLEPDFIKLPKACEQRQMTTLKLTNTGKRRLLWGAKRTRKFIEAVPYIGALEPGETVDIEVRFKSFLLKNFDAATDRFTIVYRESCDPKPRHEQFLEDGMVQRKAVRIITY